MNYFIRKIYFSLFLSLLVVLTTVTCTYAFLSTNRNTYVENFDVSIGGAGGTKSEKSQIVLSVDGFNFYKDIPSIEVKRAILSKKGYSAWSMSDDTINSLYISKQGLIDVTPNNYLNLSDGFTTINHYDSNTVNQGYISFDLYVSTNNTNYTNLQYLSLYFAEDLMSKCEDLNTDTLIDMEDLHPTLDKIPSKIKVNAANASRVGIVVHEAQDKYDYEANTKQVSSQIYRFDDNKTNISSTNVYNFGGITPKFYTSSETNKTYQLDPSKDEDKELYNSASSYTFNTMQHYYNQVMQTKISDNVFDSDNLKYRDEYDQYIYNSKIFGTDLKLTYDKMVKLTIYLWVEGWDSDCFNVILRSKLAFDLKFTTDYVPE